VNSANEMISKALNPYYNATYRLKDYDDEPFWISCFGVAYPKFNVLFTNAVV